MKAKVNDELCIGCGACCAVCPQIFEIGDEGFAVAKDEKINDDDLEDAKEAEDGCPTSAIRLEEKEEK